MQAVKDMSGRQLPAFDESRFEWETVKSKNGKSFRVGREKTLKAAAGGGNMKVAGVKQAFGISVDWPVEGQWKETSGDVKEKAAITNYKLGELSNLVSNWPWGKLYCLEFVNTEDYDYFFHDETGDSYEVNTFFNGYYVLLYDSEKPTIKFIRGS